jgi:hypothetical protein
MEQISGLADDLAGLKLPLGKFPGGFGRIFKLREV